MNDSHSNRREPGDPREPGAPQPSAGGSEPTGGTGLGDLVPAVELPRGGGALRGIGESFSTNAVTGTAGMGIPVFTSPSRALTPQIALSYDSGAGNGVFGLGWHASVPSVRRKTDRGLPRYDDAHDSDVFVLSEAEDLVPWLDAVGDGWVPRILDEPGHAVHVYRPRVEAAFARIERWVDRDSGVAHWRVWSRENVLSVFGESADARIAHPQFPTRIFEWLLERVHDDRGNITRFRYKAEDLAGVAPTEVFERERLAVGGPQAQRHLERIHYGNRVPAVAEDFAFEVVFDYGEYGTTDGDHVIVSPEAVRPWPTRIDPFSNHRATFEVRTWRLCRRVLMFHHFPAELGPPLLVRSTDLEYDEQPTASLLRRVVQRGYLRDGEPTEQRYRHESWPALTLEYTPLEIGHGLRTVDPESLATVSGRIDGRRVRLIDLDGEGLPGLLTTSGKGLYYARPEGDGRFGPPRVLPRQPSPTGASSWQLVDLDGDGVPSFAQLAGPQAGAFKRVAVGTAEEWAPHRPFRSRPNFDLSQPNVLMLDVTGDGLADVVVFELGRIVFYPSLGHGGFAAPVVCGRPAGDDRSGPRLVFGDATRAVFLADMTGDGLSDLVRVENGRVLYWPNQGYGRFGRVVEMAGVPWFDRPDRFRADRIRFGDIDGSGTADLVYLGGDGTRVWINAAGNRYAAGVELPGFPTLDTMSSVELADILGTGGAALVWSTSRAADRGTHVRYAELTPRGKPYLLRTIDNGMGLRRTITYAPSTRFYLEDRAAGRPWVTRLPFVVHVVEHVEVVDAVTQRRFGSRYRYHHGYFDGAEREFRGFAVVEQIDTESFAEFRANTSFPSGHQIRDGALFVPPVLTRTRFHTGAWLDADAIAVRLAAEDYRGDPGDPASVSPVVLPASALPSDLSPGERREAMRALRGRALRQEVYAMALQPDGSATHASPHPYRVVEGNATVRRLQPRAGQRYASFLVHDRESLEQHYERDPSDPRLSHAFTLAVDDFGNVTRTAAVSYRRRGAVVPGAAQDVTAVVYGEASVANAVVSRAMYRVGVPIASRSFEVTGIAEPPGGGSVLSFAEVDARTFAAPTVAFEAPPAEGLRKRLLASSQQRYYADDLGGALPLGQVGTRALPFEQRAMFASQAQIAATFAGLLPGPGDGTGVLDVEGGFVAADGAWWRRSGRQEFDAEGFYLPVRAIDAFGGVHAVDYDAHRLHVVAVTDPLGNVASSVIDYRVLQAATVTDANGNRQQAVHDALGLVVATVVMGKDGEGVGDTLAQPTVRMTYDLHAFAERGAPVSVRTFRREQYASVDPAARILESVAHYDGGGRVVQTKAQAEPGLAPHRDAHGVLVRDAEGRPELVATATRWVGSGRTIVDNKGNPVKQYEPFFSDRSEFDGEDELAATGVTPLLHYDAFGRLVRTDFPDGTVSRVEIEAWRTVAYDPNDTVLEGSWFAERMALGADAADRRAAELTAAHANTPSVAHADSLGRPVLTDVHDVADGVEVHAITRQVMDVEGNVLQVVDARGNVAESRVFGMGGAVFVVDSVDAGWRRMLVDVAGAPLRGWNARGFVSRARYDALRRATHAFVTLDGGVEMLVARTVFGESVPGAEASNLRGRAFRVYDGAGVVTHERFDFAGNLRRQSRRLARGFEVTQDWGALEVAVPPTIEGIAAVAEPALEAETFVVESEYDALGRVIASTTPDQSVTLSAYNEAGLLEAVAVRLRGAATPTSFVSDLDYNARGQRQRCVHGNGTVTTYEYDARTFRLARLRLVRDADSAVLQDLRYTYDPSGNVMQIRDGAQQARFFANAVVSGDQRFEYSAMYRLVRATGREHASLGQPVDQDFAFGPQPHPDDPAALREYTQEYRWDVVGNLLRLQHGAAGGSYTRQYAYAAAGNRLLRNSAPSEAAEPFSHSYSYDEHGNMTAMPHLAAMAWDHADRLQHADLGGGGNVWFVYDAAGERVRKVQVNVAGSVVRERVYLGGVELYRERAANSATPTLVRESLHVGDDTGRLCLVETLTVRDGVEVASPVSVQRHQYGNHLGSASLELDGDAAVISYEEFHPFGTTSYAANDAGIEFSAKRYRYIGKERDEETGLYHLGARYYASWLGRWTAADPIGLGDGENRYAYVQGNPARLVDSDGMKAEDPYAKLRETHAKWNAEVPPRAAENEDGKPDTGGAGFGKPIRRAAPTQPERTPPPPAPAGPGATGEPGWRGPPSEAPNWLARLAAAAAAFRSADSRSGSGAGSSMLERVAAAFAVMSGGRGKFDAKETKLGLGSEDTGDGSGLPPGLVIAAVAAREAAYGGALGVAGRLLGGVGGLLRKVGAEKLAGMLDDLAERVRAMRSVPQAPASSAMNARELKRQLTLEEASAVFTESGALHPEVIAESGVAIPGGRLGKPTADFLTADGSKIDDWAKYTTKTFKSPAGDFQVHFYMNSKTGAVNYDRDYKAVFNDQGVR